MGPGNDIWDITPKAQAAKAKIDKWDYTKLKSFLHSKGNNRQSEEAIPMEWEKIFANNISEEGLISTIYNKLIQLNSKNMNNKI